jgi:hypothetical protein
MPVVEGETEIADVRIESLAGASAVPLATAEVRVR